MRISDWSSTCALPILSSGCISAPDMTDDGVALVASMDDLLAHKLKAIHDRADAKDYEDIAAILTNGHSLERGLAASEALFGSSVPAMVTLKALPYFADVRVHSGARRLGKEGVRTGRSRGGRKHS